MYYEDTGWTEYKLFELLAQILGSIKGNVFIAPNCVFSTAGHPCKVIRKITEADKKKYPIFEESMEN